MLLHVDVLGDFLSVTHQLIWVHLLQFLGGFEVYLARGKPFEPVDFVEQLVACSAQFALEGIQLFAQGVNGVFFGSHLAAQIFVFPSQIIDFVRTFGA